MRKLAFFLAAFAAITGSLTLTAVAENPATVNATVTALTISVSVSPNSVAYGTRQVGTADAIPSPAFFTATNNGNVNENFAIRGSDTAAWELNGTAGPDTYVHRFSTGSQGPWTTLDETTSSSLVSGVTPTGNVQVFLNMDLPTSTTANGQQNAAVTIIATQTP